MRIDVFRLYWPPILNDGSRPRPLRNAGHAVDDCEAGIILDRDRRRSSFLSSTPAGENRCLETPLAQRFPNLGFCRFDLPFERPGFGRNASPRKGKVRNHVQAIWLHPLEFSFGQCSQFARFSKSSTFAEDASKFYYSVNSRKWIILLARELFERIFLFASIPRSLRQPFSFSSLFLSLFLSLYQEFGNQCVARWKIIMRAMERASEQSSDSELEYPWHRNSWRPLWSPFFHRAAQSARGIRCIAHANIVGRRFTRW